MHSEQRTLHESGAVVVAPLQVLPAFALPVHEQAPFTHDDETVQLDEPPPLGGAGGGVPPELDPPAGGAPPPPAGGVPAPPLHCLQSVLQESAFDVVVPSQTFPALGPSPHVHAPFRHDDETEQLEELPPPASPLAALHFSSSARHAALPTGA